MAILIITSNIIIMYRYIKRKRWQYDIGQKAIFPHHLLHQVKWKVVLNMPYRNKKLSVKVYENKILYRIIYDHN